MIDPDALFEFKKSASFEKSELFRIVFENRKRRLCLLKEFSDFGAEVFLVRPKICAFEEGPLFEFSSKDGINRISVRIAKKSKSAVPFGEILKFCAAVSENSSALAGLFSPDAVICGGTFPFAFSAAKKIADENSSVLITESYCDPKKLLRRTESVSALSPVLTVLKKAFSLSFEKSDAVLGFFPDVKKDFFETKNLFPLELPSVFYENPPCERSKELFEKLAAFREGKTFVLVSALPLEDCFSMGELITAASLFEKNFALVFCSAGTKEGFFKKFVSENGIKNVFFLDAIPDGDEAFVLSAANAVYLSENGALKGCAFESERYFSALFAEKPILAAADVFSDFFKKTGGAVITKPRSKESLRLGIKALLEMSEADRNVLGLSNRSFGEKHSFKNFAKEYFSLIDNLVKQKETGK